MSKREISHDERHTLRQFTCSKFVQRDEFYRLLVSCRKMIRSDEPAVDLRGLVDIETGTRFLIKGSTLFQR